MSAGDWALDALKKIALAALILGLPALAKKCMTEEKEELIEADISPSRYIDVRIENADGYMEVVKQDTKTGELYYTIGSFRNWEPKRQVKVIGGFVGKDHLADIIICIMQYSDGTLLDEDLVLTCKKQYDSESKQ